MRKASYAPIVAILLVAAIARVWAIDFCLPTVQCRPDEEAVVNIVIRIYQRYLNPGFFDWPSLFFYTTAAALLPYFQIGRFLGWFQSEGHFVQTLYYDPTPLVMAARLLSAAAGTLSVWLIYRIGLRFIGRTASLVAALFLALAFLHVRDSHFGVTDVSATCFVLVSFLFTLRYRDSRWKWDILAAGFAAGLATSTKYNAALIVVPALVVILWPESASLKTGGSIRTGRSILGEPFRARLWLAAKVLALLLVAFVMTTPYSVLRPTAFFAALKGITEHLTGGHGIDLGRGYSYHLTASFRYGLGVPLLVSGIAGLVLLTVRAPRLGIIVGSYPVLYFLLVGSGYTVFARYIMTIVPFLCLGGAYAVTEAARWIAAALRQPARATLAAWILAAAVIAPSAWSVVQFDRLLARSDSRVIVANWIREHYPAGATIGTYWKLSMRPNFIGDAIGKGSRFKMWDIEAVKDDPDLLIVPTTPFPFPLDLSDRAKAYLARYTPVYKLEAYDADATDLIYDWQDEFYLPLTTFGAIDRPGPTLTVYARPASSPPPR